jgi:tetratricopeptide (TPR) repeat protein
MVSRSASLAAFFCVALLLLPVQATAQIELFVQTVRELADATRQTGASRSNEIHAAASRMGTALVEWDRTIAVLEGRTAREISGAPDQRAYLLHVELGVVYRARGRLVDALREFDAAVALRPSASDVQVLRALTLEAAGRPEEAAKAFRAALKFDAGDPVKAYYVAQRPSAEGAADAEYRDRARALLTDTYRRLGFDAGRPAGAPFITLDVISDNLSRTPLIGDDETAEGFALLIAGKYGEAVAALTQADHAKTATGDSPLEHFARGQRDEAENRAMDARREYQAALRGALLGRSVLAVGIARLAQVDGDQGAAIEAFTHSVQLNPNDPNIHKEFSAAYAAQGRPDDAFCELMAAFLINPRDAQTHAAIGQLYLDGGRNTDAVAAFDRALKLAPDRYETRYALATAQTRLGNTAEAARQLDMFDRLRREALERRRRDIANEVEQEEAIRRSGSDRDTAR